MDGVIRGIKNGTVFIAALVTAMMGGWDLMLKVLSVLIVLDYLSGLASAWVRKVLSSAVGARGIMRKVLIFLVIMVAAQVDLLLTSATASIPGLSGVTSLCRSLAICFYIANEGLSILENASEAGLPIPKALIDALEQLRKKGDEGAAAPKEVGS